MGRTAWVLCLLLLAATLAACGSNNGKAGSNNGPGGGSKPKTAAAGGRSAGSPETTTAPRTTMRQTTAGTTMGTTAARPSGAGKTTRVREGGAFSWIPPQGWKVSRAPNMKFRVAVGPPSNGFAPNMNVVEEAFSGSLADYADANLKTLKGSMKGFRLISRSDFKTNSGDATVRLVTEDAQQNAKLRQTFYLLDGGNKKFVVTCSRLASGQQNVDASCDKSMKSFRIETGKG